MKIGKDRSYASPNHSGAASENSRSRCGVENLRFVAITGKNTLLSDKPLKKSLDGYFIISAMYILRFLNHEFIFRGREIAMLKLGRRGSKTPVKNDAVNPAGNAQTPEQVSAAKITVIGENISIEGMIQADEDIVIEGSLKGSLTAKSHQLTIGKKGRVEADIQAENIVICGRMKGAVIGFNKVQINQGADFTGQIKAKSIAVEDGAFLKATIELDKEIRDKTHATPQHHLDAIVFPAEAHNEKKPIRELAKPDCKN
jgi:cytoskeletal protein CcmA (bactofilin family)